MIGALTLEDEIDGAHEAKAGPEIVEAYRFLHVNKGEGNEDGQGYHFLEDLELRQGQFRVSQPVRRDLDQVFEEGNAPAGEGGDVPRGTAQVLQVGVPREGHEDVGNGKENNCFCYDRHLWLQKQIDIGCRNYLRVKNQEHF